MSTTFHPDASTPSNRVAEQPETLQQDGYASAAERSTRSGAPTKPGAGGMLHPFTVRNFNLLFGGQTVSAIGDALYAVALPWLILSHGGSAQDLGLVLTAYGIPRVGGALLGGWLSDRLRPRRVMLIADTVRALLVAILAALALGGHPTILHLCAVAVPLGALGGAFTPAAMSILPDTLSDDDLQAGNALNFSALYGASLIGSALAGVVVATFTAGAGLALDGATFVVSALSLALMRQSGMGRSSRSKGAASRGYRGADAQEHRERGGFWRLLRTSRLIQIILLVAVVAGLCWGGLLEVALPTLVHGPLQGGAGGYGAILAACSAGLLIGGLFAGTLGKFKHKGLLMLGDGLLMAAAMALIPVGGVRGAMVCMLLAGLATSITNVLLFSVVQLSVPRHLLGRVMGLLTFASFGMYPISATLAGVLANQFGPVILFPFSGMLLGVVMLLGCTQKALREL
jgi:MFS family permease